MMKDGPSVFPPPLPDDRPFDVVGLGGNAADYILTVPHFPRPDTKMKFSDFHYQGGGRTATPMVALARWGCRVRYLGAVGDDADGRQNLAGLQAEGIETEHVRVRPGGLTQRAFILVDERTGERTIIWGRSDGLPMEPEEIEEKWISSGRFLYTDAQNPRAAARAGRMAREAGMPVLADIEDIRPGLDEVLPWIDFLIVPRHFPELATGRHDLEKGAAELEERTGGGLIVVTLGAEGCAARIDARLERFPAYEIEPVDTTGAGDIFHAAFTLACLSGMELREALDFSNAAAAMNCRSIGGRAAIPADREAIEEFRRVTPRKRG